MKLKLPVVRARFPAAAAGITACVILSAALLLGGCASDKKKETDETSNWSAQRLFVQGMHELDSSNYAAAIKLFESLESRYPYGHYAEQAQLEVAYAHYKNSEPASAVEACDRFIKMHPNNPDVDYAYYLKGLSNFVADSTVFSDIAAQDPSERDTANLKKSFDTFRELTKRYPDSRYTPDATQRMKLLVNLLAEHEIHIAIYYYNRKSWVAAAGRAEDALQTYPQAPINELGLAVMARSYAKLGAKDLSDEATNVLRLNYPDSKWLNDKQPLQFRGSLQPPKTWWKFWAS